MNNLRFFPTLVLAGGVLLLGAAGPLGAEPPPAPTSAAQPAQAPQAAHREPPTGPQPVLGAKRYDERSGRWVAPLGNGTATLTLDARLQDRLEKFLASYQVPWGAVVVMEPSTGRVLAMAEHSSAEPGAQDLSLRALAPAASVFKIVTASALLRQGVPPEEEVCYHGGGHRLQPRLLADDPRRDHRCVTLASALGKSANVVFAKLASRGLTADALRDEASRFLFDAPLPFAKPVQSSTAKIPADDFGLANTAAGFGEVRLSPLHAAILASIVANGGVFVPPVIVDEAKGVDAPWVPEPRRVVEEDVARALSDMMETTVTEGTARRAFHRPGPSLGQVTIAGKTGSLAERDPYRDYSWFVGFAPVENPRFVVAAVVVNNLVWRVKATTVAREAFAGALKGVPRGMATASAE